MLEEESRTAVIMQMYGYSLSEISEFLQVTFGSVDSRLRRAKQKLKQELMVRMEQSLQKHKLNFGLDPSAKWYRSPHLGQV